MAVLQEVVQQLFEVEQHGTAIDQAHVVDAERGLQLGHLVEFVEQHVRIEVLLDIDDDAHTMAVALVVDVGDALNLLFLDQTCDILDQVFLVDVIRDLVDHDAIVVVLSLDFGLGTYHDAAATSLKSIFHTLVTIDDTSGGEIGSLDVVHQVAHFHLGILEQSQASVDALAQIVRCHVGGHADCNTRCAVHQQVRDACGQH